MNEISDKSDRAIINSDGSIGITCPLTHHGCQHDQKLVTSKEHYDSEQYQKSLATLAENISENETNHSDRNSISEEVANYLDKSQEQLLTILETTNELNEELQQINSNIVRLNNQQSNLEEDLNDITTGSSMQKLHIDGIFLNENVLKQDINAIQHQVQYENCQTKRQVLDGTNIWKISNP
ncbi:hypothetical protein I4U23_021067 [Adineta vaga]|nr:hypothetical protein I4U23_021067 [Adineta vaga]